MIDVYEEYISLGFSQHANIASWTDGLAWFWDYKSLN